MSKATVPDAAHCTPPITIPRAGSILLSPSSSSGVLFRSGGAASPSTCAAEGGKGRQPLTGSEEELQEPQGARREKIDGLSSIRMYIIKDLLPVKTRENTGKLKKCCQGLLKMGYLYWIHKRISRYVTSDDVVQVKGKLACEISPADGLTLTELMFSGTLKDAIVEQMVALLSCFVWQEMLQDAPKPREELDLLFFYQLQETARRIANLELEGKLDQGHLEAEGGSAAANSGIQADWGN